MSTELGQSSLSNLRTLLQALSDQLSDEDEDRTQMSRTSCGQMVANYLVAQSAPAAEQSAAAEAITQVLSYRAEAIKGALSVVDALQAELSKGGSIDYKQIPGIDELLG